MVPELRRCAPVEEEVRMLCGQLLDAEDPSAVQAISQKLQSAIHEHIEELRSKVLEIPAEIPGS